MVAAIISTFPAYAQQGNPQTYRGTVTDSAGLPIPGASVILKNTNRGAITDAASTAACFCNMKLAAARRPSTMRRDAPT